MTPHFSLLDWSIVAAYFGAITLAGVILSRRGARDSRDYFLAGGGVPPWLAAISVLATTQSAATFLGGPDYGYRGDFTYLSTNLGALAAAAVVANVFMPRFYAEKVGTVYELLGRRFGANAMRAAGLMFLVGRVLAGGARLYLAAIAVSMLLFLDVSPGGVIASAAVLVVVSFLFTFHGGLRSIVWIDLLQFIVYVTAALAVLILLRSKIPASLGDIVHGLRHAPHGVDKLRLLSFSLNTSEPFALPAVFTGVFLLLLGNFALDQDTTQRLLACKDTRAASRGLYLSVLTTVPVVALFVAIGSLLYVFYQRPDLMGAASSRGVSKAFRGADITVFMNFILTEAPSGLRGLATVGVIATAVGTTMSALNAMSSVLIQDFYRPWRSRPGSAAAPVDDLHFVQAGRVGMALMGVAILLMAVLSFFWQRYLNTPLLEFVLSVMAFAYAGLLGVYFTAVFTRRGSTGSVIAALIVGFLAILALQPYVADAVGLPAGLRRLAFPWQLCLATSAAFLTCLVGRSPPTAMSPATV